MYVVNNDLSIYCTRGDYCHIPVQHQFQSGDVVRFKAFRKKDCNTVVIQRDFTVESAADTFVISLTGTDTKIGEVISKPVDYWYEVELNPETNPQTIIGYDDEGAKVFTLFPEGKDVDAEDIEVVGTKTLQELVDYALSQAKESGEFNGEDGKDGKDGQDGYTPVKGEDYFTEDDKTEILDDVTEKLLPLCSNAIKATASGEIVRVDDVSPIEHIVMAKVRGKNLIPTFTQDYSVTRQELTQFCEAGGNTITINGIGNANGGGRNNFRDFSQHFFLKKGKTYTLSQETVSGSCDGVFSVYISKTPDSDSVIWTSNSMEQKTFVAQDDMECYIGVNVVADVVYNNVVVRFQLEEGNTATEYEPYIDPTTVTITRYGADETDNLQTFTPGADGTCEIPSLYPVMTLTTDTAGAIVECEYNRDSNVSILCSHQDLTPEQQAQARKNIGAAENPVAAEKYFDIDDDGLISLKPEYRGIGDSRYSYSVSDNGVDEAGSLQGELPEILVIPEIVNEIAVVALAEGMFCENYRIKAITIPQFITEIPKWFCCGATKLESVYGTENVEKINTYAFQKSGIKSALFPHLKEFGGVAHFAYCVNLIVADIGSVTALSNNCFYFCEKLTGIRCGAEITELPLQALYYTHRLRNLAIAPQLTKIDKRALYNSRVNYDWLSHQNCEYGEMATYAQWNPEDWWSQAKSTTCYIPLKSTFNQQNPEWYNPDAEGEAAYPKNCQVNAAAAVYSIYENKEISSPLEFIEAVKAIDPSLMENHPGTDDGIASWLSALGYTVEICPYNAANLQKLYDALSAGHLVIGGVLGISVPGAANHAVLFHGVTDNGEIMVTDSSSYSIALGIYEAVTYSKSIQNMAPMAGNTFIIVKNKSES